MLPVLGFRMLRTLPCGFIVTATEHSKYSLNNEENSSILQLFMTPLKVMQNQHNCFLAHVGLRNRSNKAANYRLSSFYPTSICAMISSLRFKLVRIWIHFGIVFLYSYKLSTDHLEDKFRYNPIVCICFFTSNRLDISDECFSK